LPLDAAQQAADRLVRIYTIGFGSTEPEQMVCTPEQLGSDAFSGSFGGGSFGGSGFGGGSGQYRRYLILDEPTLQGMAEITGGTYYRAEDADQLYDVFVNLPNEIVLQKESLEISVFFAIVGALLAAISTALALIWHRFP
jgi:Ca-activated chloride channel family protein